MVVLSHPTGNVNVSEAVRAFYENQLLSAFFTCISWNPDSHAARFVPASARRLLERRARIQVPPHILHTRPVRELLRNTLLRLGNNKLVEPEESPVSIESIYRDLDAYAARSLPEIKSAKCVYAFEDGALDQFQKADQLGMARVYDLPIGYWKANRQISSDERELEPVWCERLKTLADSESKLARKDRELALADVVIVASTFTKNTLRASNASVPIVVIPYGAPTPTLESRAVTNMNQPLRLLYVGSLTQRKGISYLFQAAQQLGNAVTLTLIGRQEAKSRVLDTFCAKHRWLGSLPHDEVLAEMRRHDVFVFPSLFEGFGLVIGEALSQGLPVITTPNTGGPDILRDGVDGFIVPIRSSDAIVSSVLTLFHDRNLLRDMSEAALCRASDLDWGVYRKQLVSAVSNVVTKRLRSTP